MYRTQKGFTLIELLVVIAIIGILSSVVLSSLSSARDRAGDASARSSLNNARAQADLYYTGNGNTYSSVCDAGKGDDPPGILDHVEAADDANGDGAVNCFDESEAGISRGWAIEAQLIDDPTRYFCTDYSGNATVTVGSTITATDATCGL